MLDIKKWVFGKLNASASLQAALGGSGKVAFQYPNDFSTLPIVTYSETNQSSSRMSFFDNRPTAVDSDIQIDVWTAKNSSTSAIAKIIDDLMINLLFTCVYSSDIPDPSDKTNHRVCKYSRAGITAEDLV